MELETKFIENQNKIGLWRSYRFSRDDFIRELIKSKKGSFLCDGNRETFYWVGYNLNNFRNMLLSDNFSLEKDDSSLISEDERYLRDRYQFSCLLAWTQDDINQFLMKKSEGGPSSCWLYEVYVKSLFKRLEEFIGKKLTDNDNVLSEYSVKSIVELILSRHYYGYHSLEKN